MDIISLAREFSKFSIIFCVRVRSLEWDRDDKVIIFLTEKYMLQTPATEIKSIHWHTLLKTFHITSCALSLLTQHLVFSLPVRWYCLLMSHSSFDSVYKF